ncbi:MAG: AAA family ATPase, partial [Lachnospiraceae bacterium]|nr:AAA family ATPase [Lachnospiraceae bacterium]
MGIYLNQGNEGFQIALRSEIYIDKSELIAHTNKLIGTEQRYLCVSRPRRFGKSMAANMLKAYYGKGYDSKPLFLPLKIAEASSFEEHLNQYDVIHLDIQGILAWANGFGNLISYLEKDVIEELRRVYGDLFPQAETSLSKVVNTIYESKDYTGKGFIFIVDEWDCIFREAKGNKEAQRKRRLSPISKSGKSL